MIALESKSLNFCAERQQKNIFYQCFRAENPAGAGEFLDSFVHCKSLAALLFSKPVQCRVLFPRPPQPSDVPIRSCCRHDDHISFFNSGPALSADAVYICESVPPGAFVVVSSTGMSTLSVSPGLSRSVSAISIVTDLPPVSRTTV